MIETPLFGKFYGEDRRLIFSATAIYHALVRGCIVAGAGMFLYGLAAPTLGSTDDPALWILIGVLVMVAGIAAALSLTSITFDLKERCYKRREGPGIFPRQTVGAMSTLDAVVLISEPSTKLISMVTYHLLLHWKASSESGGNPIEPPMVLQSDSRELIPGQPLNIGAQMLLQAGIRYSQAIGVPFYDNSQFASKCPVPLW